MLVKIELENFFSIRDRICIDFRAGNTKTAQSKKLADNVIEWNGLKLLKSIGLFGANASGKSNILKAINFCCHLVLESHQHNENSVFNYAPFKFGDYKNKPSNFLIDFICDDVEYEYSFSLLQSKIISESVLARPNDVALNTSDKNLFLSRASSMNRELAQGLIPLHDMNVESYFDTNKALILAALQQCDSDICDVAKKIETIPVPIPNPGNPFGMPTRVVNQEMVRFVTYHKIAPDVPFDMDEESGGTKRLFSILLRMIDVVFCDQERNWRN
jgi:AAA15 family ATPase/GTPase